MTSSFDKFLQTFLENPENIFPMPERMYPKFGVKDGRKGGTYFTGKDLQDVTDNVYGKGSIDADLPGMKAKLDTSDDLSTIPPRQKGKRIIKTNLYRREGKFGGLLWDWVGEPATGSGTEKIVSVYTGGKHYYALRVNFDTSIHLATYPKQKSEPRLRPTAYGSLEFGKVIGQINTRPTKNTIHSLYDVITIV